VKLRRSAVAAVAAGVVIIAAAAPAQAWTVYKYAYISRSLTTYQTLTQVCHSETAPMSFWNDGSAYETKVKNTNGGKTYVNDLTTGEWVGWTSAQVPPGYWYFTAKITTTSGTGTYRLDYSIVYRPGCGG
jgi:hypothetical protein